MKVRDRIKAPTPRFFRTLRNAGLILAAIGGALISAPVTLPVGLVTLAGYAIVAGGVASAVSQTVTKTVSGHQKISKT